MNDIPEGVLKSPEEMDEIIKKFSDELNQISKVWMDGLMEMMTVLLLKD